MKTMLKKINILLLSVALLVGSIVPAYAADETAAAEAAPEAVAEEVVIEKNVQRAMDLLYDLNIIDDDTDSDVSGQMSRAEFAVLACKFAGMNTPLITDSIILKDVLSGSLEEPYIYTAVTAGFMSTVNDGYFYPAWAITSEEAAKTLLMSMGYGDLANQGATFARFAGTLGLYDNIKEGVFTRGEAYKMIYNALHAEVMDQTSFGEVSKFVQLDGINALYKFHKVVRTMGIVNGADGIVLGSGSSADLPDSAILLDGVKYYLYNYDTSTLLGRHVRLYWYDDRTVDVKEVVSVEVTEDESITLTSDIIEDYANLTYTYEDGAKSETIDLKKPYVIYNGEEYTGSYTKAIMKPAKGDVTIISNAGSDESDLVIIRSYTDIPVKSVISDDYVVIGKEGENLNLDYHFDGVSYFTAGGAATNFSKIAADTVISVAQSISREKTVIYVSDLSVSGQVVEMNTETDEWTIVDKAYKLSAYLKGKLEIGAIKEPDFRSNYTFYMNTDSEIVYFEKTEVTSLANFYAIIAGAQKAGGLSDEVTLKIFAKTLGGFEVYPCAEKVTLNGKNATREEVMEALKADGRRGAKTDAFVAQPARVGLNEDNEINFILQAGDKDYNDGLGFYLYAGSAIKQSHYRHYRDVFCIDVPRGEAHDFDTVLYDVTSGPRANTSPLTIGASNKTEYIQIPYHSGTNEDNSEWYKIDTASEKSFIMASRPSASTPLFIYTEEPDSLEASFVVLASAAGVKQHTGTTSKVSLVVNIKEVVYEEDIVTMVEVSGGKKYYIDNPNINPDNLRIFDYAGNDTGKTHKVVPGDMVNMYIDSLGYIQAMEIVYSCEQERMMGENTKGAVKPDITSTSLDTWHTESIWNSRSAESRLYLLHLYKIDGGYFMATMAKPDVYEATLAKQQRGEELTREDRENLRRYIGILPTTTIMDDNRGVRKTRNATSADLVSYTDSKEDYVTLVVGVRYAQQSSATVVKTR